jgi:hypothetical protein
MVVVFLTKVGMRGVVGVNISDVKNRVDAIREIAGDPGRAHAMEDDLYVDVLREIANGGGQTRMLALARQALRSQDIGFSRWTE